ncbi:adenylate/guanylate cyclase domain-containing protein [Williamsia sp. CHRR-6]|uniref:adenylate/guanylate cyclase domain-containing protein n=1 Tax=Williamsia sp. CHRR-6 TaxID=2835871 RepID=UPI001BDA7B5B|nr:adenylate/guanylate cyclase domain-containing protein [Williamsia sp. CHRR-6]MBT0566378.1 HAMP domain-containing protein [Williamsia sp. CHRR-6]
MGGRATATLRRSTVDRLLSPSTLPGIDVYYHLSGFAPPRPAAPAVDLDARRAIARRLLAIATLGIVTANVLVGIETMVLLALVTSGGDLSTASGPLRNTAALVAALVVGAVANVAAGIALLRPQILWFISGTPADVDRRRAVQRIPVLGVLATAIAWVTGVITYAVATGGVSVRDLSIIAAAFALAGASSGSVAYMVLERAGRPLVAAAMADAPPRRTLLGVRERLFVLWIVCSGVPLVGMLLVNIGRGVGWLPASSTAVDITTVVLAVVCLASGLRAVALISTSITDPVRGLRRAVEAIGAGDYSAQVEVYDSSDLGILQHGFNEMVDGLAERERLRDLFGRHVGHEVAALALRDDDGMHGTITDVGVLFVDIEGSTRLAESTDPRAVAEMLNRFFTIVADVIGRHGGFINKFEGDAALAVFGAPTPLADASTAALRAARELDHELAELAPLRCGIGVSAGTVFAGHIGAETRYEYTVIGDPVNECARLAEVAKRTASTVLASGAAMIEQAPELTALDAADAQGERGGTDEYWEWVSLGTITLRGRSAETEIFAPAVDGDDDATQYSSAIGDLVDLVDGLIRRPFSLLRIRR